MAEQFKTYHISEVKKPPKTSIPQQRPRSASSVAGERVRSTVRRVQQSAMLGGYWLFSGGTPVFIRTTGKNVRSGKQKKGRELDKLPKGPSADRTINTSKQKKLDAIDKPATKTPSRIARIERLKPRAQRRK